MRKEWVREMLVRYHELVAEESLFIVLLFFIGAAAFFLHRTLKQPGYPNQTPAVRWAGRALVAAVVLTGLWLAIQKASLFDDAYISLRYARNLLDGHGLVWNPGERVEGYTNFLWVMLVAAAAWISRLELPLVALVGCLASYVGCVLVFARMERGLFGAGLPLATVLFALQNTTTEYATSGLETAFATLCTLLGLQSLLFGKGRMRAARAGLWFIAATLCRPDHSLFYIAGGFCLLLEGLPSRVTDWPSFRVSTEALANLGKYAATFVPYAVYLAWKLHYYGELLPNTYYAKSASLAYFSQGGIYALSFVLGAHLWLIIPIALLGFFHRNASRAHRTLTIFALVALPLYNVYVAKVGGDFMYGRFYLVTLPLWLLLAWRGITRFEAARVWKGAVLAGVLVATLGGVRIVQVGQNNSSWYLGDESGNYRVEQWFPRVKVDHHSWRGGNNLGAYLEHRGIEPVIATGGIGMVGYYSDLELVDLRGLTDHLVARTEITKRRKPGHEKSPPQDYLDQRGVQIIRAKKYHPKRWRKTTAVDIGAHKKRRQWRFYRYDADLADQIEARAPEIGFTRFEPALDDWLAGKRPRKLERLEQDAAFFEMYYFCCNDDPERKAQVEAVVKQAKEAPRATAMKMPSPTRRTSKQRNVTP